MEPTLAGGGKKEPFLPARSSRLRFWPCPLVLALRHLALSAVAQPPQAPAFFPGGAVCRENPGLGAQHERARLELLKFWDGSPAGSVAGLCLGFLPEPRRKQAGPCLTSQLRGSRKTPVVLGAAECYLWASVCLKHTQNSASRAGSFYGLPPSSSPHTHSPDFIFKEIITAISNSFVWFQ